MVELIFFILGRPSAPCPPPPPPPTEQPVGLPAREIILVEEDKDKDDIESDPHQPLTLSLVPKPEGIVVKITNITDNKPAKHHHFVPKILALKFKQIGFNRRGTRNH